MLKDLFKNGIKAATTWVGSTLGGPTGAAIGSKVGESLGSALFDRKSNILKIRMFPPPTPLDKHAFRNRR